MSIVSGIRATVGNALGRVAVRLRGPGDPPPEHPADRELTRLMTERLKQASVAGRIAFLPYLADMTGEDDVVQSAVDRGERETIRDAYRKMLGDPYVKSAIFSKVLSVASLDLQINPSDMDDPATVAVADTCRNALEKCAGGYPQMAWDVLIGALLEKHSLCEKVWGLDDRGKFRGKVVLKALKPKDPRTYRIAVDEFLNVTAIEGVKDNAGKLFNPADYVYFAYASIYGSPVGMSDLRAAYRGWWKLDTIGKLRMIALDRYSGPYLKGKISQESYRASMETALRNARAEGYIVLAPGDEVEVSDLMPRGTSDYASAERDAQQEIVVAIVGAYLQILEGKVSEGRGDSRVHRDTAELFQWHLSSQLQSILNQQVLPHVTELNHGRDVDPPKASLGAINLAVLKDELIIDQGLLAAGIELSRKEVYQKYGRTPPKDDDDKLRAPQPTPGPFPPGQPGGLTLPFDDAPPAGAAPSRHHVSLGPARGLQPAKSGDVAIAGADGAAVARLLSASQSQLVTKLHDLTTTAAKRLVGMGGRALRAKRLFDNDETADLADALAATLGTARLLGAASVRERQQMAEERRGGDGSEKFSDTPTPFLAFADAPPEPQPPAEAIEYFRRLIPTLGIDPKRFGPLMERQAFTAAAAVEQTLLDALHSQIREALEDGRSLSATTRGIQAMLDRAGVTPRNPQYAEMVARTNLMDAYNAGATREMQDPDVQETFPAWKYLGIKDGRQGKDHEPHFGRYYPVSAAFADVRGPRVWNCRCGQMPVDKWEWDDLQKRGATLEKFSDEIESNPL